MVLHLVGVGLGDEQDITLKGLNALKRCSKIYLEAYTSVLTVPKVDDPERNNRATGNTFAALLSTRPPSFVIDSHCRIVAGEEKGRVD